MCKKVDFKDRLPDSKEVQEMEDHSYRHVTRQQGEWLKAAVTGRQVPRQGRLEERLDHTVTDRVSKIRESGSLENLSTENTNQ